MSFLKKNSIYYYLTIFIISFLPMLSLLKSGYINGHDNAFHMAQIQDIYDAIRTGNFNYYLNYETCNYFSPGVRLMYAPLAHLTIAVFALMIKPFGLSIMFSYKFVLYLSILLSGIFTFNLVKKMTNNNMASLVSSLVYVLFPYRFTDIYIRNALAETIAFTFIPLLFDGIYSIINLKKKDFLPFLLTIIGASLLFMTHNLTLIYTVLFVIIFALFNIKKLVWLFKQKWFYIYCLISFVIIFLLISPLLLPLLESKINVNYCIFNKNLMNNSKSYVLASVKNSQLYLMCSTNYRPYKFIIFLFLSLSSLLFVYSLKDIVKNEVKDNLHMLIISSIVIISGILLAILEKINFATYFTSILTGLFLLLPYEKESKKIDFILVISILFMIILSYIFVNTKWIWNLTPQFLNSVQFAWRIWTFFGFFLSVFLGLIYSYFSFNKTIYSTGIITSTCLVSLLVCCDTNGYKLSNDYSVSEKYTYSIYSAGWQLEYFTEDFYNNNNSVSKSYFWWEAYNKMYDKEDGTPLYDVGLLMPFNQTPTTYKDITASFDNYNFSNDKIEFDITCITDVYVEIPKCYNLGYVITVNGEDMDVINTEGFVSFRCKPVENGHVVVKYEGTFATNSPKYLFTTGLVGIALIYIFYFYKKNKEINLVNLA